MVGVFLVHSVLLKGRVAQSHEVVETAGGLHDGGDCFRRLLHGAQQTLEPVGQNGKCILNNAAGTRETVVEDAFFIREVPLGEGLHQPGSQSKRIISNYEVRCVLVIARKGVWSR